MAITNNLKKQVDLPVWEWCRFAPATVTAVSSLTTGNTMTNRYLYYQVSSTLYRYDTYSDTWHQLSSVPVTAPTIMNNNVLSNSVGHFGQAIAGGTNTIQLAGLSGHALIGYKIRITSGTGVGQERTITDVSAPTVHERGMITTGSSTQIIDASAGVGLKQWKPNQWKNYQVRIDYGTGKTQLRPILYNTQNTLTFSDVNYLTIDPWANCPLAVATVASSSLFVIESHQVTVDTNWSIAPDETSRFVILSGGIWNITQGTTSAPFFSFAYYDLLSDVWYQKSTQSGLKTLIFAAGSDLSMERFTEAGGAIVDTTAVSSATTRSITTAASMAAMQYANFELRIVSGTGAGQSRTILTNTTTKINVTRDWDTTPDATSSYQIYRDVGKVFLVGGGDAGMLQYSQETDQWTTGKQLDSGQCNQLAVKKNGDNPIAITSITKTATGITGLNTTPVAPGSGYNINDLLTLATGTGGVVRVTGVSSTGGVTSVALESVGTGYSVATFATTVVPAGGSGCTIGVTAVDFTEYVVTPIAHNYKIGDTVTISGATGTGAAKFNGAYVIIGIPTLTTNLSFSYCSVGDPGAVTATIPYSPSTTQLVDCTKNWVPNEHVGKLVQLSNNVVLATGQVRRIVSNTATTLTWTLAATAPVNGQSRYVIEDIKPFGTERTSKGEVAGTEGFATGGSTTTLVDSTKNWETNYWSRTANRKVRIVEGTGVGSEIAITSNTATTLTFATQTFTPDATTRYVIMDTFGTATSGTTTTLVDSSQNWEVNYWIGKRVRFLSGTSQGNEYAITANTATQLTFGTGTAPDVSTAYAILEAAPKTNGIHIDCVNGSTDTAINNNYLYAWTGTATAELSRYNIHTEHWERLSYFPQMETMTTGAMYVYDGRDRIYYLQGITTTAKLMYYDVAKNIVVPASQPPYGMGTALSGNRMEIIQTDDGLKYLYLMRHSGTEMWRVLLYW